MCLAVPGKLIRWIDRDPVMAVAEIEFGGVRRPCHMACVPTAEVGDFVIVHAGIALEKLDERQAEQLLTDLAGLSHPVPQPPPDNAADSSPPQP